MALTLNSAAVSHARRLIQEGKIDHGAWDGASAPRNAETCLAHDESKKGTEQEWKYPVISGGHVNVKGVASAAGYASTEGAEAIASVAHRLSSEIHSKTHGGNTAMSADAIILHGTKLAPGKPVPMALTGLPAEVGGLPAHYLRKEVARVGHYTHRGDGSAIDITPQRADAWVKAFNQRLANGYKPFVPGQHRATFNAADNHGYVVDLKREGESLFATMQLIGDGALELAAKNDVSIYVIPDALDAKGNKYPEALEHIALTPNPALPDLTPFVKIAASADAPARDVPVYELSANPTPAPSRKDLLMMTPELAKQFREKLGIAADVPDDKLPDLAATKALSLSADVQSLTTKVTELTADVEAKSQQVLQLSADKKAPDPLLLGMFQENIAAKREQAISAGALTEVEAKSFDALLAEADGRPSPLALSACGTTKRPFAFQFWDAVAKLGNNAVRTGLKLPPGATEATPNPLLRLSGDGGESDAEMIERTRKEAEKYREEQLKARGLAS